MSRSIMTLITILTVSFQFAAAEDRHGGSSDQNETRIIRGKESRQNTINLVKSIANADFAKTQLQRLFYMAAKIEGGIFQIAVTKGILSDIRKAPVNASGPCPNKLVGYSTGVKNGPICVDPNIVADNKDIYENEARIVAIFAHEHLHNVLGTGFESEIQKAELFLGQNLEFLLKQWSLIDKSWYHAAPIFLGERSTEGYFLVIQSDSAILRNVIYSDGVAQSFAKINPSKFVRLSLSNLSPSPYLKFSFTFVKPVEAVAWIEKNGELVPNSERKIFDSSLKPLSEVNSDDLGLTVGFSGPRDVEFKGLVDQE